MNIGHARRIPFMMIFFFIFTDGYAAYWTYPLVNGINFDSGFVSPDSSVSPNIAWYALCILGGALFVYFLCDHKMYIQYGKHGLFESTFLVAFPAGILGARLFYVIGNWNLEFANQPFSTSLITFCFHESNTLCCLSQSII